ncbi:hypothetical protein ACJ41O_011580 [Fusarium nematophilum]
MPPFAAELEEWWLDSGYEELTRLLDGNGNQVNPRQCGFAQHVQSRLLAFDNDRTLQARIQEEWPAIRAARGIDYEANPRKNLREAACNIFRRPEDGGINYARVMDGLGYLDAMEVHRLRLMEATKVAIEAGSPEDHQLQLLAELHRTASTNYRSSHAGFRTCILIQDLTQDAERGRKRPQIMARVNALFPSTAFLEDKYDIDPTPYSASLLESLRFNIFEHLMAEDPFSQEKQQMIQMRLLSAKTDGAAFAGDFGAPPILCYPDDVSKTEFYQHPLARELDMTSLEKSILGLIIPKELKSRDF